MKSGKQSGYIGVDFQQEEDGVKSRSEHEVKSGEESVQLTSKNDEESLSKSGESSDETPPVVIRGRLTFWLLFSVLSAVLSSLQYGYHLGVVNSAAIEMRGWFAKSYLSMHGQNLEGSLEFTIWSICVSIYPFGGIFGGMMTGWLADSCGRKRTLLYSNILVFFSTALTAGAKYVGVFYLVIIGRFIVGINCGINSNLVPLYLAEISPANLRGAIGTIHQVAISISILLSLVFGLSSVFGNERLWPMLFGIAIVPCIIQLATLSFCPESPKYNLVIRGKNRECKRDLDKLRGEDASEEFAQMKKEADAAALRPKVKYCDLLKEGLCWPLTIALLLVILRQLSGVNVINFYSTEIFMGAGLSKETSKWASVGFGLMKVITTFTSAFLVDCKCCGRRLLLLIGFTGCFISLVALTVSLRFQVLAYLSVGLVLSNILSWSLGPGTVPWFYITEVFSSDARGRASSLASTSNWTTSTVVAVSFLFLKDLIGTYAFAIYAGIVLFALLFTFFAVPETREKSPEQIRADMRKCQACR